MNRINSILNVQKYTETINFTDTQSNDADNNVDDECMIIALEDTQQSRHQVRWERAQCAKKLL